MVFYKITLPHDGFTVGRNLDGTTDIVFRAETPVELAAELMLLRDRCADAVDELRAVEATERIDNERQG